MEIISKIWTVGYRIARLFKLDRVLLFFLFMTGSYLAFAPVDVSGAVVLYFLPLSFLLHLLYMLYLARTKNPVPSRSNVAARKIRTYITPVIGEQPWLELTLTIIFLAAIYFTGFYPYWSLLLAFLFVLGAAYLQNRKLLGPIFMGLTYALTVPAGALPAGSEIFSAELFLLAGVPFFWGIASDLYRQAVVYYHGEMSSEELLVGILGDGVVLWLIRFIYIVVFLCWLAFARLQNRTEIYIGAIVLLAIFVFLRHFYTDYSSVRSMSLQRRRIGPLFGIGFLIINFFRAIYGI